MINNAVLKACLKVSGFLSGGKGQAMTEYGLIIALIAVGVISVLGLLTGELQDTFQKIVDALEDATD